MKIIITTLLLFFVQVSYSQLSIKKSSIDSGGETTQNGSTYMLFTVGEVVVNESSTPTLQVSEGFINPDMLKYLDLEDYQLDAEINVYPNPTVDIVNINFNQTSEYEIQIFDSKGKLVAVKNSNALKESFDFSNFPSAQYTLLIKNTSNQTLKAFRIIKQ